MFVIYNLKLNRPRKFKLHEFAIYFYFYIYIYVYIANMTIGSLRRSTWYLVKHEILKHIIVPYSF